MAILSLTEAKTFLSITGTTYDAIITALIPEIEGDIVEYCNNGFYVAGVVTWPAGIKMAASKMLAYQIKELANVGASVGLESERQGGYSYTKETGSSGSSGTSGKYNNGYPASILTALNKWKLVSGKYAQQIQQYRDRRGMGTKQLNDGQYWHGQEGTIL